MVVREVAFLFFFLLGGEKKKQAATRTFSCLDPALGPEVEVWRSARCTHIPMKQSPVILLFFLGHGRVKFLQRSPSSLFSLASTAHHITPPDRRGISHQSYQKHLHTHTHTQTQRERKMLSRVLLTSVSRCCAAVLTPLVLAETTTARPPPTTRG
jgi:hypothetical protein